MLEFKLPKNASEVEQKMAEGECQVKEREYAKSCSTEEHKAITAIIVANDEKRQTICKLCQ